MTLQGAQVRADQYAECIAVAVPGGCEFMWFYRSAPDADKACEFYSACSAGRPMDFTGRPMKGMVFVGPEGLHGDALRQWVDAAADYARGLSPKPAGKRR